jgi:hypothetical protein
MSNNPLTKKTIVDKNGVVTTRFVVDPFEMFPQKKAYVPPGIAALTKSSPDDTNEHQGFLKELGDQKNLKFEVSDWRKDADDELVEVCSTKFNPETKYRCSGAEIYDVMSTVDHADIMPLLAVGVRTGEEAQHFLKENGLKRLIMDNSETVTRRITNELDPFHALTYVPGTGAGASSAGRVAYSPTASSSTGSGWRVALSGVIGPIFGRR